MYGVPDGVPECVIQAPFIWIHAALSETTSHCRRRKAGELNQVGPGTGLLLQPKILLLYPILTGYLKFASYDS